MGVKLAGQPSSFLLELRLLKILDKDNIMKKIIAAILSVALFACQQAPQAAPAQNTSTDISQVAFTKAMEKYLESESGQEKIGETLTNYIKKQQQKAALDRDEGEKKDLEEQFKNPIKVDIGNSQVKGKADAKVTIVEFSDFECPFCKRGADTMDQVAKAYPNDVKIVFKNLPLAFHKNAKPAAIAALAAGKQGKFWEMHDKLFANQRGLTADYFEKSAKEIGLNVEQFKKDITSPELAAQVDAEAEQANAVGISGTPGFLVNGVLVRGAYPFEHFKGIIDRWLAEKK